MQLSIRTNWSPIFERTFNFLEGEIEYQGRHFKKIERDNKYYFRDKGSIGLGLLRTLGQKSLLFVPHPVHGHIHRQMSMIHPILNPKKIWEFP